MGEGRWSDGLYLRHETLGGKVTYHPADPNELRSAVGEMLRALHGGPNTSSRCAPFPPPSLLANSIPPQLQPHLRRLASLYYAEPTDDAIFERDRAIVARSKP